ncbi:hypothetical protein [Pedobacter sp. Leaf170]|uniref:hypothetical protein n=1 Tax=Pedobacter sp. Leaf170 TaxID=2876558 RepID=UPI001E618D88|nr:hypothetical protein [Pedobacter sp. Leaf170]
MKRVLIISPYFPPDNAADMQRVRMSLPYFERLGWKAEIVCVDEQYTDLNKENLFRITIPSNIKIHKVKAFPKNVTTKFGIGSIAIRSMWYFKLKVDLLLKQNHYDLIYFSTTQYLVCILGSYWKKKFKIPYIIDLQDPWHTEYYQNKPKTERPKKYWFSYRLNKFLEPMAMREVSGIIAVSQGYIDEIKVRYTSLSEVKSKVIPFSAELKDFQIADEVNDKVYFTDEKKIKILYAGVVGNIMVESITKMLTAFKALPTEWKENVVFYFLGTSYAPKGTGVNSVLPIAKKLGVDKSVIEVTNRLSYFNTLRHLRLSDGLLIVGSDEVNYIPSKIYTYILANKPIFSLLNSMSPGNLILTQYSTVCKAYLKDSQQHINAELNNFIDTIMNNRISCINEIRFTPEIMAKEQVEFFNSVIC